MSEAFEIITSRQNKYVSLACSLDSRKGRDKARLFRVDGIKLFCEAVRHGVDISFVIVSEPSSEEIWSSARRLYGIEREDISCRVLYVTRELFEKISSERAPEGIMCVCEYAEDIHRDVVPDESGVAEDENILLLESVRDPSNIGAIIRSAAAFGVDRIIMSSDCADIYNPKALRSSMGTVFGLKIDRVLAIDCAIDYLRSCGREVYAATLGEYSVRLGESEIPPSACVLIGNEGHGLSEQSVSRCTGSIYIPMREGVESLNASVAASVLMWEFFGKEEDV